VSDEKSDEKNVLSALTRPGSVCFKSNEAVVEAIKGQIPILNKIKENGSTYWCIQDQPRIHSTKIKVYPSGHMAFYNQDGRRFLSTDPEGNPLNECEWTKDEKTGKEKLAFVRMQIDCQLWFGIQPEAKTFTEMLDMKGQEGWEMMSREDLQTKAAAAWDLPLAEVKHFYKTENIIALDAGKYEVRLAKDGLYALLDGTFEDKAFVSYMPSLNWTQLDIIPVVELYQSTLPGCGAAAFELLWGLYEDQSRDEKLPPLRFRGIPTFPSQQAFNIFSAYLIPKAPKGEEMMDVFMNFHRSHEIEWSPRPDPPLRYFSKEHSVCLTIQDKFLYKATALNDTAATPYINMAVPSLQQQSDAVDKKERYKEEGWRPYASVRRQLHVGEKSIQLVDDGQITRDIPMQPLWKITPQKGPMPKLPSFPFTWKHFFGDSPPEVDPVQAILTVPLYPEGATEIEEPSVQPMAVDQIIYYMEDYQDIQAKLKATNTVLIHTFDTVISGCIDCTQEREVTVLYSSPEWAQKNALLLWEHGASKNQLEHLRKVSFLSEEENIEEAYQKKYDMIYKWIPFFYYQDRNACDGMLKAVVDALNPGGLLFLVGPKKIRGMFDHFSLKSIFHDPIADMPYFKQHLRMYPETLINPDVEVFFLEKENKK